MSVLIGVSPYALCTSEWLDNDMINEMQSAIIKPLPETTEIQFDEDFSILELWYFDVVPDLKSRTRLWLLEPCCGLCHWYGSHSHLLIESVRVCELL
jgi:hypothetical protein